MSRPTLFPLVLSKVVTSANVVSPNSALHIDLERSSSSKMSVSMKETETQLVFRKSPINTDVSPAAKCDRPNTARYRCALNSTKTRDTGKASVIFIFNYSFELMYLPRPPLITGPGTRLFI